MRNKRGQEGGTSTATLVGIVILIVLLVLIVMGVSGGFSNFWAKLNPFGGNSNVQTIIQACELACSQPQDYDYCTLQRDVKYSKDNLPADLAKNLTITNTCDGLRDLSASDPYYLGISCSKTC